MRAHEAGALHGDAGSAGPGWLRPPADVNALVPSLWPATVERRPTGELAVAGVGVDELAGEFGTPLYVLDEADLRGRARSFRTAFQAAFGPTATVYYASKALLTVAIARWVAEEGLYLDVSTGGELAVAMRAGVPGERILLHGNNKSCAEIETALRYGVGRIVLDAYEEIERVAAVAAALGVVAPVLVRVTVGVEAHTHEYIATAHEDQKFGFSLAGGHAPEAARRVLANDHLQLRGLHTHIGSQIFDDAGFEVAARRVLGLQAAIRDEHGVELPELDLGGGFGVAYTTQDDPSTAEEHASRLAQIVRQECDVLGLAVPHISVEPGRAIVANSVFTLYTVGVVKPVEVGAGETRRYVAVDGGMSDNIRPALYDASYSCTLADRSSGSSPVLSRVVGKHCESGDIVVKDEFLPGDVHPGDLLAVPGTGAYCRSMASNYNHVPRPPIVAVRDGRARLIVRRETIEDLLRLEVDTSEGETS
ncbi:MAG: diaminopimelate decarboxylase [Actinomycetales bacterium]